MRGAVEGLARIEIVTSDLVEALSFGDVVLAVVPAYAHADIAKHAAEHVRDEQYILLCPGRTGGALEFSETLRNRGARGRPVIAEAQTILHTCRLGATGADVEVFAVKHVVSLAALPATRTKDLLGILKPLFPQFAEAESVLETSLNNMGAMLHPAPTLLNIGWIETLRTQFLHYYEGITPAVAGLLEIMDRERLAVAAGLGTRALSITEWLDKTYGAEGDSVYDALHSNEAYREIFAPSSIHHRYFFEDIPTGLTPIASIGDAVGVDTPTMDAMILLASKACRVDFQARGRSASSLGLSNPGSASMRDRIYGENRSSLS